MAFSRSLQIKRKENTKKIILGKRIIQKNNPRKHKRLVGSHRTF
jgi:hypothetical protein